MAEPKERDPSLDAELEDDGQSMSGEITLPPTVAPIPSSPRVEAAVTPVASPSVVPPGKQPAGVVQGSRRWLFVAKHYCWTSVRSPAWLFQAVVTLVQAVFLFKPLLHRETWPAVVWIVGLQLLKAWKASTPKARQIVPRNYDARALAEYKLIHAMADRQSMTPPQVEQYQRDALALIASYVRDHRADWRRPTIFANLLIEEGEAMVVIARDHDHRHARARYPKEGMIAWAAFSRGVAVLTGDIKRDYPSTPADRPYNSVIALPVHQNGEVVAVVSIDSTQKFHFDLEGTTLVGHLRPLVALLAWTLPRGKKRLYLPHGQG